MKSADAPDSLNGPPHGGSVPPAHYPSVFEGISPLPRIAPPMVRVLDRVPSLRRAVPEEERALATRLLVAPLLEVREGPCLLERPEGAAGLVVLSGLLAMRLHLDGHAATVIVGRGDFTRPWSFDGNGPVVQSADWRVLQHAELVVLDRRFWAAAARWPGLAEAVLDTVIDRARANLFFMAVRQSARIEERLLLAFWHLADRYGRVCPAGVVIDLPNVTHQLLGELVAARRPSITTALRRLREIGALDRDGGSRWILHGTPEDHFESASPAVIAVG
jgi:CRP/FNR family transcriptional regulator, cyclic AMP receptor protein